MKDSLSNNSVFSSSYWERATFLQEYDVLIIGSGIVGLNAAIRLKEESAALKIGVLERGVLPNGASTKNAGFACFGSVSELIEQQKKGSEEELLKLVEFRWKGLETLTALLGKEAIRYQQLGGYELFDSSDRELFEACQEVIPYYNKLFKAVIGTTDIYAVSDAKIADFGFAKVQHLIENRCEAQIDTGRMMQALLLKAQSMGIIVINCIHIKQIEKDTYTRLIADGYTFAAKKVLIATNAFAQQLIPELDVVPGRGQVIVTQPIPNLKVKGTFHYDKGYYYFRNIDNRLLFGGGRNLDFTGEATYEQGFTDLVQNRLEQIITEVILPGTKLEIDLRWSGIMGFGKELSPILKKVDAGMYAAVRCNGMGVAMGSIMGRKAAEMLLND